MLFVDFFKIAVVIRTLQVLREGIGSAREEEVVRLVASIPALTAVLQIFVISGVAVVLIGQVTGVQGEAVDLVGDNLTAFERLRQQARVAARDRHVLRFDRADF